MLDSDLASKNQSVFISVRSVNRMKFQCFLPFLMALVLVISKVSGHNDTLESKMIDLIDINRQLREYEHKIKMQKKIISEKDQQLSKMEIEVKNCADTLKKYEKNLVKNCEHYRNYPGVHEISLSLDVTFKVLCENTLFGNGWTVIQQRINGNEDFHRDWNTYRDGFGSFDGDFFLGLEKIHLLTKDQPHELMINLETFNESVYGYLHYSHFAIAGEDEHYRIITLDPYENEERTIYLLSTDLTISQHTIMVIITIPRRIARKSPVEAGGTAAVKIGK